MVIYQSLFVLISMLLLLSTFLPFMPGRREEKIYADDPAIIRPDNEIGTTR